MITSGNCFTPDPQTVRDATADYLSKVSRSGPKKPITIESIFFFTGEVDAVIRWKQRFPGYDPKKFPMSSFGGKWLRIEFADETLVAAPGDYVVRTTEGEYYPIRPEHLSITIREDHANQPAQTGSTGSQPETA